MGVEKSSGDGGDSSKVSSVCLKSGDRQIFTVELRPGETTVVSWKKLMREANKANASTSLPDHTTRGAPGQPAENEEKDAPHRFSAVIEKIERLYMGKHSSDEEDLNDFPDDDEYNTEDSFIDDAELDEYFEVDNSAIKHVGFFVHRGKLERINEPPVLLPNQPPKKRRRKDLAKAQGENDDGSAPDKNVKTGKTALENAVLLLGNNTPIPSQSLASKNEHSEDWKAPIQLNASEVSPKKKSTDTKMNLDLSTSLKVANGDGSLSLAETNNAEDQKTGAIQLKSKGKKLKNVIRSSDASLRKHHDQISNANSKSQSGRPFSNAGDPESSIGLKVENKTPNMHKKDGSSIRPKVSMLEKAIRELDKMVAESRPPAMENQEADISFQAVKRRLPNEVRLKLAKVARLAQASDGKISKELINRLMSILGHLIQLRTLKRNLKVMINMGLSAEQEKDDGFQMMKKEIVEMIKVQLPSSKPMAYEQQAGASDEFQELGSERKVVPTRKFILDTVLEDKICDLYDLYVDGLDEDAGPQIRKLYVEIAKLWPNGFVDNHGIKRAICRVKERRRALSSGNKNQDEIKRKKRLASRLEETVRIENSSVIQTQHVQDRLGNESSNHEFSSSDSKPISNATVVIGLPTQSANDSSLDNFLDNTSIADGRFDPAKLTSQQGEEMHKPHKQAANLPRKSNFLSSTPPTL